MSIHTFVSNLLRLGCCLASLLLVAPGLSRADGEHKGHLDFSIRSVRSGKWSAANTWQPARLPTAGDRVLVSRDTVIEYDVREAGVIRLLQVVGVLSFARDTDTELNVGVLKVQDSAHCSESGFACDFLDVTENGEPRRPPEGRLPALLVGTPEAPIPAQHTARIRLHFLEGMDPKDAPAIACCSARMEFHGAPLDRTWVKLAAGPAAGEQQLQLSEAVSGWRVGDQVIVTPTARGSRGRTFRNDPKAGTEQRRIVEVSGRRLQLDRPLDLDHSAVGQFQCEVANLSRNVVVESANPKGVRGHTVFHRFSQGGISYARFAHLGKEGVLGRYAIHFHLVGDTMRGSEVVGAAIVDSHNRWITIHGTQYLIVRDCVGFQSVGHGFFLEDATEVYNLLDRNLGVQAYRGKRLPDQVLPFDPNDGAAFWWANGRNTLVRNVSCENDEYGFRYDIRSDRYFDSTLPILQPDGGESEVDVRTIPIWRFEDNEAHSEGLYGVVVAGNGASQPDTPIRDGRMLQRIKSIDWTGPDRRHPHTIRHLTIWNVHYGIRPQFPNMLFDGVRIHASAYGVYRPAFDNHVYRNLHLSFIGAEPFNRGMDDASAQLGRVSVDGLTFETGYGNSTTPLIQISDNNLSGSADTHLRNVTVNRPPQFQDRWPLINRGVGTRVPPVTDRGVPIYLHDYFGPGRDAKVVSGAASTDGFRSLPPLTGHLCRVQEVSDATWPELLDPVDDLPPATMITAVRGERQLVVRGVSHDNGEIDSVMVNGKPAEVLSRNAGVVDWQATIEAPADHAVVAHARDQAGNVERTAHRLDTRRLREAESSN